MGWRQDTRENDRVCQGDEAVGHPGPDHPCGTLRDAPCSAFGHRRRYAGAQRPVAIRPALPAAPDGSGTDAGWPNSRRRPTGRRRPDRPLRRAGKSMRSASRSSGVHSGPTTEAISRVARPGTRLPIVDRIVLADHLAEVAGRREMMMQAAVGDEEHLAARNLAVDDAADVDAGLADQVAAELDDELRLRQRAACRVRPALAGCRRSGQVERLLAREVRECRSRRRG